MALYFLDYDLRKKRDYQTLYDELAGFNAVRILESMWCFRRFETNATNLRDYFKDFVDSDDGLCVTQVDEDKWATYNALGSPKDLK